MQTSKKINGVGSIYLKLFRDCVIFSVAESCQSSEIFVYSIMTDSKRPSQLADTTLLSCPMKPLLRSVTANRNVNIQPLMDLKVCHIISISDL